MCFRRTQSGNALLLSICCLLPGFSLSLVLECLGKVFMCFLYLAFSRLAEIDLLETADEAKDADTRRVEMTTCDVGGTARERITCSALLVSGNDARADTGLVGDLRAGM